MLRQQGATRGFLLTLSVVVVACGALFLWMAATAGVELDRNSVPRSVIPVKPPPQNRNGPVAVPYDPGRSPAGRQPDGIAEITDGSTTVRMKYQWVERPLLELSRPVHTKAHAKGKERAAGDSSADRLTFESSGKAEPYNPNGYEPHCKSPQSRDDSDLCAQWLAAREVASANKIARSGLAFQWLNLVVTLFVGFLTVIGLLVAAQATRLAAQGLDVAARVVRGQIIPVIRSSGPAGARRLQGRFENVGESPAEIVGFKWTPASSVVEAERLAMTMSVDRVSVFVIAHEKDFSVPLASEPFFAVVVDYDDIIDGRWRRWAVFKRDSDGKYLRWKHGEKRRSRRDR